MKITITGSLGNIGKHLSQILIKEGHDLTVISSNKERKAEIEKIGAKAAIGSVKDLAFLKSVFAGADAVFVMTPPNYGEQNIIQKTIEVGETFKQAIESAGIKRVVMLSSLGADLAAGTGPIVALHQIEQNYKTLNNTFVTFLRPGYFYSNYYRDIPMIKNAGFMGSNYPAETRIPQVHPEHIAAVAAEELIKTGSEYSIRYIASDYISVGEATQAIGQAIGKPDLKWVEFSDEESLSGMKQAGFSNELAALYVEMGSSMRNNLLQADFDKSGAPITGTVKINDFAKEFATHFN
ncbi:uncharacterized protein YbjT (DUF2867 family) [Pedobacter psychrotolerans]|uniref:Uncharacterized protein YbjT (DUF2867 family) n=1 Tax=Pedobacter psychrotolerans TaxID=1843235 RepID=A0A4R2HMW0_9SPHI|nr:NmrA family NAD(P)-binding protein [Pedobacter psychrotolerans]TCO31185.1 uncharacterized protein YbjT (DUF2867 family) [Pedobacter psychrotolerans]GGE41635.1 hypothetical protein GCM10011413_04320 [Pedobacter psychrotolerans]